MNNIEKSWWMHFVPECYFDTILLRKLLLTNKRLVHRKGCNNVVNDLNKRLVDKFAVGIIDKDKNELDYIKDCEVLFDGNKLVLWKHKNRMQFVFQINPPLEKWVIEIMDENNLQIEDFGYSRSYKKLKRQIKNDIDNENDEKLNNLISAIIKTDCPTIIKLKSSLHYLKDKNYNVDLKDLRNG